MEPSLKAPPPFSFPLHRRSHLKSGTYRSLVRIWSNFHGESQVSVATPTVLQELLLRPNNADDEPAKDNADDEPAKDNADDELAKASAKERCEHGEFVGPDETQPENFPTQESRISEKEFEAKGSRDGGFGESIAVLDQIENIVQMPDNVDTAYKEKGLMLDDVVEGIDLQDGMTGRQQMLLNELELIMNRSDELLSGNCMNILEASLDENQNGIDIVASLEDNGERRCNPAEYVVEKHYSAAEGNVDKEQSAKKIPESVDLYLDRSNAEEVSKSSDTKEDRRSGDAKNYDEIQLKEMEWEKPVSSICGTVPSGTQVLEDEDIEEGEIPGDVEIGYDSIDMLIGDDVPVETMDGKQVFEEMMDKREVPCSEINGANKGSSRFNPFSLVLSPSVTVEEKERRDCRNKFGSEVARFGNLVLNQEKVEKFTSEDYETESEKRLDAESCRKKKRAPSEKKKAKKKQRDRKKRAEKNRLLGVKRLKLKPIVKPKPVTYCRHYLKGRCHEGEKCKFSHDTIPLTKSTPCCHFARQSCMKGDDCPFDHDLSKYPCTNFTTKGFCNRGDNCIFLHKDSSPSALEASKSETAPSSMLGVTHSKEKPNTSGTFHQNVAATSFSFGVLPQKTNKQTVTETIHKPHVPSTKVFSPLSIGKPSIKPHQGSSSPKIEEHGKVENPMRRPFVAPKGINFLSFGKTSLEESDSGKLASLVSEKEDGAKSMLLKNLGLHEQASSSSTKESHLKVGYQKATSQSVLSTNQNSNDETQRRTLLPSVAPKGISLLSFGRDSLGNSHGHKQISLNYANASDKYQCPSSVQHKLPTSASSSGQSSDQFSGGHLKATPNSQTLRTLTSALKFAAEFESGKVKKSVNDPAAVNTYETKKTNVVGGSKGNSSKILEFLSSFSSNTMQK